MFDVLNSHSAVISSHEHLWQAALVLVEENCKAGHVLNTNRVVEVDLATRQILRVVPPAECKEALAKIMTLEQISEIQKRYA